MGLSELQKNLEKKQQERERNQSRLRLRDGDIATIRILTKADEFFTPNVHAVKDVSAKGTTFARILPCTGNGCGLCEKGVAISEKIYAWVWVYQILHKSLADGKEWKQVKRGERTMYQEAIGKPMVLETGVGKSHYIVTKFMNMLNEYGTLNDRNYNWIRTGAKMDDTTYDLIAGKEEDFKHFNEVGELKSLEEVVFEKAVTEVSKKSEEEGSTFDVDPAATIFDDVASDGSNVGLF